MIHECNPGPLLTSAAFMHHGDKGHSTLKDYVVLEGLIVGLFDFLPKMAFLSSFYIFALTLVQRI